MGRVAGVPEGPAAIQRDLNRLEKWADSNVRKFSKVLQLEKSNPMHQNMLKVNWIENYLVEAALGLLVDPSSS